MPAKNPRLTITLEPTLAAQLRRLSQLTGSSQSKLIAELLEGSEQVFSRLIQVLEAAETAKASLKGSTADSIKDAQTRVEHQLGLVLADFDTVTGDLLKEAEAINRRARRRPGQGSAARAATAPVTGETPPSNRGVRYTQPHHTNKGKIKDAGQI